MVPIFRRTPREDQLGSANFTSGGIPIAPEKMLDTHIATDLIGDATFDVYDIALLVSEDSDFVPAVEFVQEMRNKHVVHVGFGGHMNDLRSKCRHRIDLGKDRVPPLRRGGLETHAGRGGRPARGSRQKPHARSRSSCPRQSAVEARVMEPNRSACLSQLAVLGHRRRLASAASLPHRRAERGGDGGMGDAAPVDVEAVEQVRIVGHGRLRRPCRPAPG